MTFMCLITRNYSQRQRVTVTPGETSRSIMRAGRSVNVMREVRQEMSGKKVVTGKGNGISLCCTVYSVIPPALGLDASLKPHSTVFLSARAL
jgi:hypothetical protein